MLGFGEERENLDAHRVKQRAGDPVVREWIANGARAIWIGPSRKGVENNRLGAVGVKRLGKVAGDLLSGRDILDAGAGRTLAHTLVAAEEKEPPKDFGSLSLLSQTS